tara:strand:- start:983 stop:1165 length:183 start_codon:yes stop_codon:yes gene_type:complete
MAARSEVVYRAIIDNNPLFELFKYLEQIAHVLKELLVVNVEHGRGDRCVFDLFHNYFLLM